MSSPTGKKTSGSPNPAKEKDKSHVGTDNRSPTKREPPDRSTNVQNDQGSDPPISMDTGMTGSSYADAVRSQKPPTPPKQKDLPKRNLSSIGKTVTKSSLLCTDPPDNTEDTHLTNSSPTVQNIAPIPSTKPTPSSNSDEQVLMNPTKPKTRSVSASTVSTKPVSSTMPELKKAPDKIHIEFKDGDNIITYVLGQSLPGILDKRDFTTEIWDNDLHPEFPSTLDAIKNPWFCGPLNTVLLTIQEYTTAEEYAHFCKTIRSFISDEDKWPEDFRQIYFIRAMKRWVVYDHEAFGNLCRAQIKFSKESLHHFEALNWTLTPPSYVQSNIGTYWYTEHHGAISYRINNDLLFDLQPDVRDDELTSIFAHYYQVFTTLVQRNDGEITDITPIVFTLYRPKQARSSAMDRFELGYIFIFTTLSKWMAEHASYNMPAFINRLKVYYEQYPIIPLTDQGSEDDNSAIGRLTSMTNYIDQRINSFLDDTSVQSSMRTSKLFQDNHPTEVDINHNDSSDSNLTPSPDRQSIPTQPHMSQRSIIGERFRNVATRVRGEKFRNVATRVRRTLVTPGSGVSSYFNRTPKITPNPGNTPFPYPSSKNPILNHDMNPTSTPTSDPQDSNLNTNDSNPDPQDPNSTTNGSNPDPQDSNPNTTGSDPSSHGAPPSNNSNSNSNTGPPSQDPPSGSDSGSNKDSNPKKPTGNDGGGNPPPHPPTSQVDFDDELKYLIITVLQQRSPCDILYALEDNRIFTVPPLMILSDTEIDTMTFFTAARGDCRLQVCHRALLKMAIKYYTAMNLLFGSPNGRWEWFACKLDDFQNFRLSAGTSSTLFDLANSLTQSQDPGQGQSNPVPPQSSNPRVSWGPNTNFFTPTQPDLPTLVPAPPLPNATSQVSVPLQPPTSSNGTHSVPQSSVPTLPSVSPMQSIPGQPPTQHLQPPGSVQPFQHTGSAHFPPSVTQSLRSPLISGSQGRQFYNPTTHFVPRFASPMMPTYPAPSTASSHSGITHPSSTTTTNGSGVTTSRSITTAAQLFQKSIKRDVDQFPDLKQDNKWRSWRDLVLNILKLQDLVEVVDTSYVPTDPEELDLYERKNSFVFIMFLKKIQTAMGLHIVRSYQHTQDARSAWVDLNEHYANSTSARLGKDALMRWLTTVNLKNMRWNNTYQDFIIYLDHKIEEYSELIYPSIVDENFKLAIVQNAVRGIKPLHDVKVHSDMYTSYGFPPPTYRSYLSLLTSAAQKEDEYILRDKSNPRRAFSIDANIHSLPSSDSDSDSSDDCDNVSSDGETDEYIVQRHDMEQLIHAYKARTGRSFRPTMPKDKWEKLSESDKKTWDNMTPAGKSNVLGYDTNIHDTDQPTTPIPDDDSASSPSDPPLSDTTDDGENLFKVMAAASTKAAKDKRQQAKLQRPPGDINRLLSSNGNATNSGVKKQKRVKLQVKSAETTPSYSINVTYTVSKHSRNHKKSGSLIDRGANGSVIGADMRIIAETDRIVDVRGIENHEAKNLKIVSAGGVATTQKGKVIVIVHQSAYMPVMDRSILASPQMEHFSIDVNERSIKVGGRQRIVTPEGYVFPLNIRNGLPYLTMRPYSDEEFQTLPHVILTSDVDWDPSVLDNELEDEDWIEKSDHELEYIIKSKYDIVGNLKDITLEEEKTDVESAPTDKAVVHPKMKTKSQTRKLSRQPRQGTRRSSRLQQTTSHEYEDPRSLEDPDGFDPRSLDEQRAKLQIMEAQLQANEEEAERNGINLDIPILQEDDVEGNREYIDINALRRARDMFQELREDETSISDDSSTTSTDSEGSIPDLIPPRRGPTGPYYDSDTESEFSHSIFDESSSEDEMQDDQSLDDANNIYIPEYEENDEFHHYGYKTQGRTYSIYKTLRDTEEAIAKEFVQDDEEVWYNHDTLQYEVLKCTKIDTFFYSDEERTDPLGYDQDVFFDAEMPLPEDFIPTDEEGVETFTNDEFHNATEYHVNLLEATGAPPNWRKMRMLFAWAPIERIKQTFKNTLRLARKGVTPTNRMKKFYRTPNPAANIQRRSEAVVTDMVYFSVPQLHGGYTQAIFYCGVESLHAAIHGVKSGSSTEFLGTLQEEVRKRGAMTKLISDRGSNLISKQVVDFLRNLFIDNWQSEPHYQHQNGAERRYQDVKSNTERTLARVGAPGVFAFLCMLWICYVMNHTACAILDWKTPIQVLTGQVPNISPLLMFMFYEPVYYAIDDNSFPSEPKEGKGRFVGFSESVGHDMTFMVYCEDTKTIIHRSRVRSRDEEWMFLNLRAENGIGTGLHDDAEDASPKISGAMDEALKAGAKLPIIEPEDMIGRTFLQRPEKDGTRNRAKIVEVLKEKDAHIANDPTMRRFRVSVNDEVLEEVFAYNDIIKHLEDDLEGEGVWKYKRILAHKGPLRPSHPEYKGSTYNIQVAWETGEVTWEPMKIISEDDKVTLAIYAKEADLLDTDCWRDLKPLARRQEKLVRAANQAKLKAYRMRKKYKYGFEVPMTHERAMEIDKEAGNTKWRDSEKIEIAQLDEYNVFDNRGRGDPPEGYQRIRAHIVYDIKHDGRHKSRFVGRGDLTPVPVESVYSGVVSLRGVRLVTFIAELNGLDLWATDIGNAYLEAKTKEKVYIVAGPEFGEREGCNLVIYKALYGLRASGVRWRHLCDQRLQELGFFPSKAEPEVYMRDKGDHYEYIAVYVDDLMIASKEPQAIIDALINRFKFKLKGTGPVEFHLGCNYVRDEDGTLCLTPRKYIQRMMDAYKLMFGGMPSTKFSSPLEKGDHPELDTSEELDMDGIRKYQSLIGALQWCITLGRIDIATAVMTMSSFRAMPRQGHLERLKRIYGYILKFKESAIRVRTELPDYSDLQEPVVDWDASVYGDVTEDVPTDIPRPLGKPVVHTAYIDANLYHCMVTGRAVTAVLDFVNQTPIDWYTKKQATVETATYGSEFVATRTATDRAVDIRNTLRYLGVPVQGKSYFFGDNKSVVTSGTIPSSVLKRRHNALAYHRVREAVCAGIIIFAHLAGSLNPADILSKHWGHAQVWSLLRPLLFWSGDTMDCVTDQRSGSDKLSGKEPSDGVG